MRVWLYAVCLVLLAGCSSDDGDSGSGAMDGADAGGPDGEGSESGNEPPVMFGGPMGERPDVELGLADAPMLLSETGLFTDMQAETLAEGVMPYEVRFPLWSDFAGKRRWLWLPEGEVIDTSDMDFWQFPVGTKLWKEFSRDGVRVETRLMERVDGPDEWAMIAYLWNDDGSEAVAQPEGMDNASGTEHDVPGQSVCQGCHEGVDGRVLGVGAIQLAHDEPGATLRSLAADGWLSHPPENFDLTLPGDEAAQAALGYMLANCAHCHNPSTGVFETADLDLWLRVDELDSVEGTTLYGSTVGVDAKDGNSELPFRIAAGDPDMSEFVRRMKSRTRLVQMPPVGSELVDDEGVALVSAWIESLEP